MHLLLIEGERSLRKATSERLKESFVVDWVRSAEEDQSTLATTAYEMIVLDINLPGMSGLELLK